MYGKFVRPREWLTPTACGSPLGKLMSGLRKTGPRKVGVRYQELNFVLPVLSFAEQAISMVRAERVITKNGCLVIIMVLMAGGVYRNGE